MIKQFWIKEGFVGKETGVRYPAIVNTKENINCLHVIEAKPVFDLLDDVESLLKGYDCSPFEEEILEKIKEVKNVSK